MIGPQNFCWWGRAGDCSEVSVQPAKPLCAVIYRREHTRNAEDTARSVHAKIEVGREQFVGIGVGENSGRHDETVPRYGEKMRETVPVPYFDDKMGKGFLEQNPGWPGRSVGNWLPPLTLVCEEHPQYGPQVCRL